MTSDSFTEALERLDPASRALLDLSLRRGMQTDEIAELLGARPESVSATRDDALRRVAAEVGMEREDQLDEVRARLAELPAEEWLGTARQEPATNGAAPEEEAVAVEEPAEEPVEEPTAAEEEEPAAVVEEPAAEEPAEEEPAAAKPAAARPARRSRVLPALLVVLVAAGIVVAIVLASGGDDEQSASKPSQPSEPSKPNRPPPSNAGRTVPLAGVAGAADARGSARIEGGRLELKVRGLPAPRGGRYEVWLYDSIIDARPLGRARKGSFSLKAKLPASWKQYRFVDVSREPANGNPNHSGESVLRVPTKRLGG